MKNDVLIEKMREASAICLAASRVLGHKTDSFKELAVGGPKPLGAMIDDPQWRVAAPTLVTYLCNKLNIERCKNDLDQWKERGINSLSYFDPHYPELLRVMSSPPPILFHRGELSVDLNAQRLISVVGSRNCDKSGADIAFGIAKDLAAGGATVVSGLALGIDAMAHRGSLEAGAEFPTVAILGNGLDSIYPTSHERLARQIIEAGGLLVSQFEPAERPFPSNFLNRNRIIAGIGLGVLVVQASRRSGSLVTARYALEEGREVMAVPGSIFDHRHEGTNKIIKDGAYLVRNAEDIWEILPAIKTRQPLAVAQTSEIDGDQRVIFDLVKTSGPMHYDQLAQKCQLGDSLAAVLLGLELADLVERQPGNYISIKRQIAQT